MNEERHPFFHNVTNPRALLCVIAVLLSLISGICGVAAWGGTRGMNKIIALLEDIGPRVEKLEINVTHLDKRVDRIEDYRWGKK